MNECMATQLNLCFSTQYYSSTQVTVIQATQQMQGCVTKTSHAISLCTQTDIGMTCGKHVNQEVGPRCCHAQELHDTHLTGVSCMAVTDHMLT